MEEDFPGTIAAPQNPHRILIMITNRFFSGKNAVTRQATIYMVKLSLAAGNHINIDIDLKIKSKR